MIFGSCREHDWFKTDLPAYLFPQSSDVDASIIDTEVIQEVCEVYFCMDILFFWPRRGLLVSVSLLFKESYSTSCSRLLLSFIKHQYLMTKYQSIALSNCKWRTRNTQELSVEALTRTCHATRWAFKPISWQFKMIYFIWLVFLPSYRMLFSRLMTVS